MVLNPQPQRSLRQKQKRKLRVQLIPHIIQRKVVLLLLIFLPKNTSKILLPLVLVYTRRRDQLA
ncbi:unnamed protein product, partial [Amoebophrya sp. A25]|eukprot:GSA25T00012757001.1